MRHGWILVTAACGHAPPPKPVPAERPVQTAADLQGKWASSDDMDWGYTMAIEPTGAIDVWIDRAKMGRCEQKGTLAKGDAPATFQITFERNECNRDYAGAAIQLKVASFTGDSVTIVLTGEGVEERHIYTRVTQ